MGIDQSIMATKTTQVLVALEGQSAIIPHFHHHPNRHHYNHHHQVLVALVGLIGNVLSFIILSTQVVNLTQY